MNVNSKLHPLLVSTAGLILDPRNARKHPKSQVEALAKWLTVHGLNQPIVLDGKKVLGGNCVLMSFRHLGWEQIPAVDYAGTSPREFAIVDNRSAELSSWDVEILREELHALENFDVDRLGFQAVDLTKLGIDLKQLAAGLSSQVNVGAPGGDVSRDVDIAGSRVYACPKCGRRFTGVT